MKKLIVLLVIMLASFGVNAQKTETISQKDREILFENSDVQILQKNFQKKGISKNVFNEEGCIRMTGKDKTARYDISMVTCTATDLSARTIDIIVLKNNLTDERRVYGEDETKTYTVEKGKVISKLNNNNSTANKGIADCFQQYKKGMLTCPNCISCVNNCWKQNKKWKRISCFITNCGSPCVSCITSLWGFAVCVFS